MVNQEFSLTTEIAQNAVIDSNLSNLKEWVEMAVEPYKGKEVTVDQVKDAKAILAMLRKLQTSCENERKSIKKKVNEPYEAWNLIYQDAMSSLSKVIVDLSSQINAIEEKEQQARVQNRREEYLQKAKDIGGAKLLEFVQNPMVNGWAWDSSWSLKSTTNTKFSEQCSSLLYSISQDMEVIEKSEDKDILFLKYTESGNLSRAMLEGKAFKDRQKAMMEEAKKEEASAPATSVPKEEPKKAGKSLYFSEDEMLLRVTLPDGEKKLSLDPILHPQEERKTVQIIRILKAPKFKLGIALSILRILGIEVEKPSKDKE